MKAISFLGTSEYKTTTYVYQDREWATRFFPEALVHLLPEVEEVVLFVTETVQKHHNLQDLQGQIGDRLRPVSIPEGRTEGELWEIFFRLTGWVQPGDEVVFDITHSFRSIPFLTFLAAAYLRAARGVRVRRILYGAFEARDEKNRSPVFDLTPFLSLLDWMTATNQFVYTGDAHYLARLLQQEGEDRSSRALKEAGKQLAEFSQAIMLCRPLEVMERAGQLQSVLEKARADMAQWARPFEVMADRIVQEYGGHALPDPTQNVPENLRQQLALIRWYMEHDQIFQAITLAREWVITAVGWRLNRGFVRGSSERQEVERGVSGIAMVHHGRLSPAYLNEAGRAIAQWPDKERDEMRQLWDHLSGVRNDLDHAGMNPSPMEAQRLSRKAREEILPRLEALARLWGLEGSR